RLHAEIERAVGRGPDLGHALEKPHHGAICRGGPHGAHLTRYLEAERYSRAADRLPAEHHVARDSPWGRAALRNPFGERRHPLRRIVLAAGSSLVRRGRRAGCVRFVARRMVAPEQADPTSEEKEEKYSERNQLLHRNGSDRGGRWRRVVRACKGDQRREPATP